MQINTLIITDQKQQLINPELLHARDVRCPATPLPHKLRNSFLKMKLYSRNEKYLLYNYVYEKLSDMRKNALDTNSMEGSPSEKLNGSSSLCINSSHFMKPGSSLPHSQKPATCPYPALDQSSPSLPNPNLEDKF